MSPWSSCWLLAGFLLAAGHQHTHAVSVGPAKCAAAGAAACELSALHHYYQELVCTPVQADGQCCPSRYDCSHMASRDKSKCYFKGKALEVNPQMGEVAPGSCLTSCFCRQTKEAGAVATLTCAHIECPSLFNPSLIPEGCVATYSADTCCSDGVLCPQNVTAETTKCEWKGKTFLEGQKFYPDEEPCKTCTCQKGFDGTLSGPWCKTVTCGLELHYASNLAKGCAPVFLDQRRCCPIEWRCPEEDDVVVAAATSKNPAEPADPAATCKWGSLTLQRGEGLSAAKGSGSCKQCRCDLPPHVTCEATRGGQPCEDTLPVAAPEPVIVSAAPAAPAAPEEAKSRPSRSPAITCDNVRCVRACVMEDGRPKCK